MDTFRASKFIHRAHWGGTYSSVCRECLAVVATRSVETVLIEDEMKHTCNLWDVSPSQQQLAWDSAVTVVPSFWYTDSATLEIVDANESALALLGYARAELIGMNARTIVATGSQRQIDSIRSRDEWGPGGTHTFIRRDGSRFTAKIRWHRSEYLGRICDFTIASDIQEMT
jgi:PAS domain S-box-containing protein